MSRQFADSIVSKVKWPLFLMANLAVLLVIGVATVRESYKIWSVDNEIKNLELKAQSLEGRKMQLSELADKMQEPSFVEKEARAKLDLQKSGEHVVILEGMEATGTSWQVDLVATAPAVSDTMSNPKRWWHYFTNTEQSN